MITTYTNNTRIEMNLQTLTITPADRYYVGSREYFKYSDALTIHRDIAVDLCKAPRGDLEFLAKCIGIRGIRSHNKSELLQLITPHIVFQTA